MAKVAAGGANEMFGAQLAYDDARAVPRRVFLNDHEIGAFGHGRASKDAHGLACADAGREGMSRRSLADQRQFGGQALHVRGSDRVAIHRGGREGRLRELCRQIRGQHPPMTLGHGHVLGRQGGEFGGNASQSFGDGKHRRPLANQAFLGRPTKACLDSLLDHHFSRKPGGHFSQ
jgi:hypothetical protein